MHRKSRAESAQNSSLTAWRRQAPCDQGVLGSDNLLPHARATMTIEEQVTREHQAQQKNRRRSLRSATSDGPSMSSSNKRGKTSSDMTEARLLPMHCLLSKCFCSISVDHFGTESRIFLRSFPLLSFSGSRRVPLSLRSSYTYIKKRRIALLTLVL